MTPYIEAKEAELQDKYGEKFISNHQVAAIVDTLLDEIESRVVPKEANKHDNLIDPDQIDGETASDYDWCGVDISAREAKTYNLCRAEMVKRFQHLRTGVETE